MEGGEEVSLPESYSWERPREVVSVAFSPGKEQAPGVWETCLAPSWPHNL